MDKAGLPVSQKVRVQSLGQLRLFLFRHQPQDMLVMQDGFFRQKKLSQHSHVDVLKIIVTKYLHLVRLGQVVKPVAFNDLLAQLFLVDAAIGTMVLELLFVVPDVLRMVPGVLAAALFHRKVIEEPAKHCHTVTMLPAKSLDKLVDVNIGGNAPFAVVEPLRQELSEVVGSWERRKWAGWLKIFSIHIIITIRFLCVLKLFLV